MNTPKRIALAIGILLVDLVVFFVPLSALFVASVVLFRPRGVRRFVERLYSEGE